MAKTRRSQKVFKGQVYVLHNPCVTFAPWDRKLEERGNLYKIGHTTRDIEDRLKGVSTFTPHPFEIMCSFPADADTEKRLHAKLKALNYSFEGAGRELFMIPRSIRLTDLLSEFAIGGWNVPPQELVHKNINM